MTKSTKKMEYAGAFFGILGTALLALNNAWSGWGFVAYLASNACWILFARHNGHSGLMVQNIIFVGFGLLGTYRWLIAPVLAA